MTIHAFAPDATNAATACGLDFPLHLRVSSRKDMPAGDKVTTEEAIVDCPACRKWLGLETLRCGCIIGIVHSKHRRAILKPCPTHDAGEVEEAEAGR